MSEFTSTHTFADSGFPRKGHGSACVRRQQPLGTGVGVLGLKRREQETTRTSLCLSLGWPMLASPSGLLSWFCPRLPRSPSVQHPTLPARRPHRSAADVTDSHVPVLHRRWLEAWPETPSLPLPSLLQRCQAFHRHSVHIFAKKGRRVWNSRNRRRPSGSSKLREGSAHL